MSVSCYFKYENDGIKVTNKYIDEVNEGCMNNENRISLYEKIKTMTIEEMANHLKPLYSECYSCDNDGVKDESVCEDCTNEKHY